MNKTIILLEGMGINPLEKIDNNCDSYWTLFKLIEHCNEQLNLRGVGCNEVEVWDKYTPEFKEFVQTCCIEKEVDKIYTYNGLNCDLDHLYFKYKRMHKIT